jgi:hypothetical protein
MGTLAEFVEGMHAMLPREGRVMMCQFRGDPHADIPGKWKASVLKELWQIDQAANVYVCVSAMQPNNRGEFRRRKENFCGGLLLMIDDLGDGAAAKFPLSMLDAARPTALIETSPGNFQAVYFFKELERDQRKFESLINAFIHAKFLGKDTGMAGVNRVFRLPAGVNGKPANNGWRVRLESWEPHNRYTVEQLAEAFRLELRVAGPRPDRVAVGNRADNVRAFVAATALLRASGMMRRDEPNMGGWMDMKCPWTDAHTGGVDNGAAIRTPDPENGWTGAFRCHHGACHHRRWRDLTQWLSDESEFVLEAVNAAAPEAHPSLRKMR